MQIKRLVKYISIILVILAMTFNEGIAINLAENKYIDIQEHWARETIQIWTGYDIVKGYEGRFRPNDYMTRGEVASVVNRIFKYIELSETSFTDVNNSIHANSLLKLHNKEIINGYPDGTVRPQDYISREELVVVLNNAFKFDNSTVTENEDYFTDQFEIAPWSKNDVLAFAQKGYINGDHKKAFNPKVYATRAEIMTMINNIIGDLYNSPKTYTDNKGKISIVNTPNIILKDMILKEKLIISEGVGDGDVILDTIKTTQDILIKGGGENSIIIKGDSDIKKIIAWKEESGVRIIIKSGSNVETLHVADGSDKVYIRGKIDTLVVDSSSNNIFCQDVEIKKLIITGQGTSIEIDKTSRVDTILVDKIAIDTRIQVEGRVSKLTSEASHTMVDGSGKVEKLNLKGEQSEDNLYKNIEVVDPSNSVDKFPSVDPGQSVKPKPPIYPKPPVDPRPPVEVPKLGYYDMVILVDGNGHVTVEKVEDSKPPIEPPKPPIGQKPNVIIVIDGKGSVLAELVEDTEPEHPLPEGRYEIKFDVEGKGNIIIEKIN